MTKWSRKFNGLACLAALLIACSGTLPPPKRRVVEADLGDWHFRRYQQVVDVEVFVEGNPAGAHTASYAHAAAEKRGRLLESDVVNVFVTEYEKPDGVRKALVTFARRLAQESGYVVEEASIGGQRVYRVNGRGEAWAVWSSTRYIVKVGGRGLDKVPGSLVADYGRRYPSKLVEGELEGASFEEDDAEDEQDKQDKDKEKKKGK